MMNADCSREFLFQFVVVFALLANVVLDFCNAIVDCVFDHFRLLLIVVNKLHHVLCEVHNARRNVQPVFWTRLVCFHHRCSDIGRPLHVCV